MGRRLGNKNNKQSWKENQKYYQKIEETPPVAEVFPTLDKSKPYAEVCGLPGAVFEQGGNFFNSDGHYVREEDCQPVTDEPDPPQSEEYTEYNQVTLQESPKPNPVQNKEQAIAIVYGDVA